MTAPKSEIWKLHPSPPFSNFRQTKTPFRRSVSGAVLRFRLSQFITNAILETENARAAAAFLRVVVVAVVVIVDLRLFRVVDVGEKLAEKSPFIHLPQSERTFWSP